MLWVLVFHYFLLVPGADPWVAAVAASPPLATIVRHGYYALDLFFLISGFLLTLPWFRHAAQGRAPPDARDFYVRRVRRIVPAYYLQLAVLFLIALPLVHSIEIWWRDPIKMLANIATHATFMHYSTPNTSASLSINGVLWSLTLEAQYYLLLPLLAPLFVRAPLATGTALLGVAMFWRWLSWHDLDPLVGFFMQIARPPVPEPEVRVLVTTQLPGYLGHFAVGILAGRAWLRVRGRPETMRGAVARFAIALLALYLAYRVHAPDGIGSPWNRWLAVLAAFGMAMVLLVTYRNRFARLLLANSAIAFVGKISYSVFLYHLLLLTLWARYIPAEGSWLAFPVYFILVLVVAWLSWRFVESPFLKKPKLVSGTNFSK